MKSTAQLTRENNVKSLRLNNTDREIFENYMTYVRSDLRVNPHDSEIMLNKILKTLLKAQNDGMSALDFFNHNPKAHAEKEIKSLPNETIKNIFRYIYQHFILLIGIFCFCKGFIGFFIGGNSNRLYIYSFPFTLLVGLFIIFLFIWVIFKSVQLQCFNHSNWVWSLTYLVIGILFVSLFYVFFIPQSFFDIGPYINITNWNFIILSALIIPIALFIDHHKNNKNTNTSL